MKGGRCNNTFLKQLSEKQTNFSRDNHSVIIWQNISEKHNTKKICLELVCIQQKSSVLCELSIINGAMSGFVCLLVEMYVPIQASEPLDR